MIFKTETSDHFERQFKKLYKKYPSLKSDILSLKESLSKNPFQGESLGKNCYKVRLAIKSKNVGKSGGARVITFLRIINRDILLVSIYDKSERENISNEELISMLKSIDKIN
jgi:hypothetical protein